MRKTLMTALAVLLLAACTNGSPRIVEDFNFD